MAQARTLTAQQGDTLDQLIWRDAGLGANDLGRILAANTGIADHGEILPIGTTVTIPAIASEPRQRPLIQLWD
ncbi:tail protein X [Govanella unica]|uniref:Tail protein X n=1 Tax=Govanella unica TaxID=2975056 RepID=A0A9X3TW09_9PROT|nr:tail protein X [Govania unica]MDA5192808.1 tail protein X [Govania unica]